MRYFCKFVVVVCNCDIPAMFAKVDQKSVQIAVFFMGRDLGRDVLQKQVSRQG